MNESQQQAFEQQLNLMAPAFQEAIRAVPWEAKTMAIGQKHKLYLDQVDELVTEVALMLVGLTSSDDFAKRIREELLIDYDMANNLVRELNLEVLDHVLEVAQQKTPSEAPQAVPVQTVNPLENATVAPMSSATPSSQPSIMEQVTSGVFKVAPEKTTITSLDPYREPLE